MSREEVINILNSYHGYMGNDIKHEIWNKFKELPSVTPQPFINKPCVSEGVCREDKIQVLDKIKAEIEQVSFTHSFEYGEYYGEDTREERIVNLDAVMKIIDKYKTESEK